MNNLIVFPVNDLMKKAELFEEAENHVCSFCFDGDQISEEKLKMLLHAAAHVLYVKDGEDEAAYCLIEVIEMMKSISEINTITNQSNPPNP